MTVLEKLQEYCPALLSRWDRTGYKIEAPVSLGDFAWILVVLKNKDGTVARASLNLCNGGIKSLIGFPESLPQDRRKGEERRRIKRT